MDASNASPLKARRPELRHARRYPLACGGSTTLALLCPGVWICTSTVLYLTLLISKGLMDNAAGLPGGGWVRALHPHSCQSSPFPLPAWVLGQYGGYPSEHATDGDPDAWLDAVGDFPPPIIPSHYALVKGEEPFESKDTEPFQLHAIPNNDWYDVAKSAVSRCDRHVTGDITGAANGLADKIVWVTALLDLKSLPHTPLEPPQFGGYEFDPFHRFQRLLDRGFEMVVYIPASYERYLNIDTSRIQVIHMNATSLPEYFPYYGRVNSIRTSKLWMEQAVKTGWLNEAPQVNA
jgi:hypothetical protein